MVLHDADGNDSASQFMFFRVLRRDARVCLSWKAYARRRTALEAFDQALQATPAEHRAGGGQNLYQSHVSFWTDIKLSIENGEPCGNGSGI